MSPLSSVCFRAASWAGRQTRRLLSQAAVMDGMERGGAARIGDLDRQTLRDWVHRVNAAGPDGLFDNWTSDPTPRLRQEQLAAIASNPSEASSRPCVTGPCTLKAHSRRQPEG